MKNASTVAVVVYALTLVGLWYVGSCLAGCGPAFEALESAPQDLDASTVDTRDAVLSIDTAFDGSDVHTRDAVPSIVQPDKSDVDDSSSDALRSIDDSSSSPIDGAGWTCDLSCAPTCAAEGGFLRHACCNASGACRCSFSSGYCAGD